MGGQSDQLQQGEGQDNQPIPSTVVAEAEKTEYASVAALHYAAWRESYRSMVSEADLDKFTPTHWAEVVYPDLARSGRTILVAKSDDVPVGVLISGPDALVPEHIEIEALYIAAEKRRQGVGKTLMSEALARRPSPRVVVACAKENWSARKYYQRLGFTRDDAPNRDRFWEPEDAPDVKVPLVWFGRNQSCDPNDSPTSIP